jgi:hypothetical protein
MTSAIPSGGAMDSNIPSGTTPGGGTVANPTWLPPFKLGQGLTGVFVDARGLIAGEVATATGQAAAAAGGDTSTPGSDEPGGAASPSGGAASTIPSGGGGPTPKATSQAQRQANLNAAYPNGGNPDPNVP